MLSWGAGELDVSLQLGVGQTTKKKTTKTPGFSPSISQGKPFWAPFFFDPRPNAHETSAVFLLVLFETSERPLFCEALRQTQHYPLFGGMTSSPQLAGLSLQCSPGNDLRRSFCEAP